jgi:uncharacterized DUF497 family protein
MEFEWDPGKAADNLRKHKVSFIEAATVLVQCGRSFACLVGRAILPAAAF